MNMDTIITLGSLSSFLLSISLIIDYDGDLMEIKNIIDSLSTTSLILTVTNLGRLIEK